MRKTPRYPARTVTTYISIGVPVFKDVEEGTLILYGVLILRVQNSRIQLGQRLGRLLPTDLNRLKCIFA